MEGCDYPLHFCRAGSNGFTGGLSVYHSLYDIAGAYGGSHLLFQSVHCLCVGTWHLRMSEAVKKLRTEAVKRKSDA